ncbi:restriction endonuclease subunit S [Ensifer sp. ENS05]|uniref:restriction endonuclease subunit S n=1 Tax=Ensifer sp. ENS05 TaxID=2769277 RepID=UPI001785B4EF|nr:restriction endonuclease subunit S [Ensifer sp. ENS05]MBD9596129.1 restriction endonuclease subunit S [Ensifer sp. ENS05]
MTWCEIPFEELYAEPSRNGVYKAKEAHGSGAKIVNMGELFAYEFVGSQAMARLAMSDSELEKSGLRNGDLLFGRRSLVEAGAGKCSIVLNISEPTTFESSIIRARLCSDRCDPLFYYYWFKSPQGRGRIRSIVSGTNVKGIRGSDLKRLLVVSPQLRAQQRIVEVLKPYDNLIENNRRRIALLEEAAGMLYREWFVHFRFPGHEHVRIVGGLPEGWERLPASEAFEVNPKTARDDEGIIRYVPMSALSETAMIVDRAPIEERETSTSVRFQNGDTLFARITPCLENGKTGYVQFLSNDEVACGSTEFIVLRGRRVSNFFVYLTARQAAFRDNAIRSMIGSSGRQRVQPSCFDRYVVAVPPHFLAEVFDEAVGRMFRQIGNLDQQNQKLAQARDLLLPRLMNGEIAL